MKWILRAKGLSFGHYKQQWFGKSRLKRSNRFCEVMERKIMLSMFLDAWQMKHQTGRKYVQALQFQSWDVWNTLKCVWFAASCSTAGLDLRWSQWSCFLRKARSTWLAQRLILMTLGCHFEVTRWIIDDIHEVHEDIIYIYIALYDEIDLTLCFWIPEKLITMTWMVPSEGAWCDTLTLWRWRLHCFLTPKIWRCQEDVDSWTKQKHMFLLLLMMMKKMNDT